MNTPENFRGGKINLFTDVWKKKFNNDWLINQVLGVRVNLTEKINLKDKREINFSDSEKDVVRDEVLKLVKKSVIKVVNDIPGQVVSNVFLRKKKDGTYRMILNLKDFNKKIEKIHFKMETLANAINLMKKDCYFGSIDLKDAYFSVNIHSEDRKFFRFRFDNVLYEFCGLPQGYTDSPRLFTKILKPVLGLLREKGRQLVGYIDDFMIQADKAKECKDSIMESGNLFDELGFTVHPEKSCFEPTQEIEFLGFVLNSVLMEVSLSKEKASNIRRLIIDFISLKTVTIRDFAQIIGSLVALDNGVWIGPIFWRRLEIDKATWLKINKFDFDSVMTLSQESEEDLRWWLDNVDKHPVQVANLVYSISIKTDASEYGWGACRDDVKTGGQWAQDEIVHINVLELKAVLFGLKSLCKDEENVNIKVFSDNSTTISCINKKGSAKKDCNDVTRSIWLWCLERNIKILAVHIPGINNVEADKESRKIRKSEWKLDRAIFEMVNDMFGPFDIDLFASRLSKQVDVYMSWLPDPHAFAINALHQEWNFDKMYCFPPFILIPHVIRKIREAGTVVTLIAPYWERQLWFPAIMKMLIKIPVLLPLKQNILINPTSGKKIDMKVQPQLMACCISGNSSESAAFAEEAETLFVLHGDQIPKRLMPHISTNGLYFVRGRTGIPWIRL